MLVKACHTIARRGITHIMTNCENCRPWHGSSVAVEFGLVPASAAPSIPEDLSKCHWKCFEQGLQCADKVQTPSERVSALDELPPTDLQTRGQTVKERNGKAPLYGVCEGQGTANVVCLKELRELYTADGELLEDLLETISATLIALAELPETSSFFEEFGFNVRQWIRDPRSAPEDEIIPLAPLSLPLIGLLSLSHFCIACKRLGQCPKNFTRAFTGITGHSQGIVAAAAIARSTDWLSFYDNARIAM